MAKIRTASCARAKAEPPIASPTTAVNQKHAAREIDPFLVQRMLSCASVNVGWSARPTGQHVIGTIAPVVARDIPEHLHWLFILELKNLVPPDL
jgi:hypothetical protein